MTDERRRFSAAERAALYLAADGRCERCGGPLEPGWHADHVEPWSLDGPTDVINGQALCPPCNLKKGARVDDLRAWQRRMHEKWLGTRPTDALICATPGAGKTYAALRLGQILLNQGAVDRLVVVAPTDALREQWADAAGRLGIDLSPVKESADYDKGGYVGCVTTYAQLAGKGQGALLLRRTMGRKTLVILDEIHHAGDERAWGDALRLAVEQATYRLALTGTPWRKDDNPIPFVDYAPVVDRNGATVLRPKTMFAYEYGEAVGDGVCRRVEFHAYDADVRWVDLGQVREAHLGEDLDDDDVAVAMRAALDPRQKWITGLLTKATIALDELRREIPSAGGLVVADDQDKAREYAKILAQITGERPAKATTEDGPQAKADIDAFRNGTTRWLVSVRMVSEGIDIPRLAVGVYANRIKTPLFFRQVVGRFVRVGNGGEHNSLLFIPSIPVLLRHAREIEEELRHELEQAEEAERTERQRSEDAQQTFDLRQILSASDARFHSTILSGDDLTPDEIESGKQECLRWGIPVASAAAVARMLRERSSPMEVTLSPKPPSEPRHRVEKLRRQELETLARRHDGVAQLPFGTTNGRLIRLFGTRDRMTVEKLDEAILLVSKWISEL